ncbi:uncharacterized protein BO95DRAFT_22406 [Aspergillus brunneoviolaceus CBS 621.78]|uniref:Uncharacterized protein n=1 Tax=Aspergillus brunneoviolaceus CBS 621.78 TaxID=1450534 RepID=A0ACD1FT27_9EURO|nr:hypothetical protein BO95DRAFT_22406 [Aspergillus brunneoviolaceus CBS 621.78]RAH40168.1 hypothetical protein BO95DRAFT_22406 [Aspergillus brunneoviolaceus CBS 621.78]
MSFTKPSMHLSSPLNLISRQHVEPTLVDPDALRWMLGMNKLEKSTSGTRYRTQHNQIGSHVPGPLLQLPGDITEAARTLARTLARTPQSKRILLERTVWTENPELYVLHDALGIFFLLWPARSVPSISGNGVAGISFFILCAVLRWVGAAGLAAGALRGC